jgi:hypothetical protein
MKDYLEPVIKKTESVMEKIMHRAEQGIDAFMRVSKVITEKFMGLIEGSLDKLYDVAGPSTSLGRLLRYLSLPTSLVIPTVYKHFFSTKYNKALIFRPGVHLVVAKPGGGKSLTSFVLAEIHLQEAGLGSYFTSCVEKPQLTEDGEWKYVHHPVINLKDYYKGGKKIRNFNTKKYPIIMKDERYIDYTPRNNKKDVGYNDRWVPEHIDELLHRHQGFTHIYKFSQHFNLDGAEMETLSYMHDVETIKDIPNKIWLESGEFPYIPIMLKFTTYKVEVGFDGKKKRKKIGTCKIPVPYDVLERFETHSEKDKFAGLPVDFA